MLSLVGNHQPASSTRNESVITPTATYAAPDLILYRHWGS